MCQTAFFHRFRSSRNPGKVCAENLTRNSGRTRKDSLASRPRGFLSDSHTKLPESAEAAARRVGTGRDFRRLFIRLN